MRLYLTLGMLALVVAAGAAAIGVAAAPTTLKDFSFLGTGRTTAEGPRLHTYGQCTLADVEGRHHQIQFSWTRFCPIMAMPKPAWPGLMGWTTCLTDLADPAYITVTRSGSRNVLLRRAS